MSTKHIYSSYYNSQIGKGIPVYAGLSRVSGHGYASMLSNVWRWLSPIVAPTLQILKKEAVNSGINILNDVGMRRPFKTSVKKHLNNAGKNVIQTSLKRLQGGKNKKKKIVKKKRTQSKKKQSILVHCKDIFT